MRKIIEYNVLAVTALFIFYVGVTKPVHNWDMIAYVAAAYECDGLVGNELSEKTYKDIGREVGYEEFINLTAGSYRGSVYKDFNSLEQQLPFYRTKVAYIEIMRLLKRGGASYPKSTYLISASFASASIFLLAALFRHLGLSLLWIPFVALFSGFEMLARLSTPDAIGCFFALLAAYLLVKHSRFLYLLAALLPLLRPDYVIYTLLIMSYAFFYQKRAYAALSVIAAISIYLATNTIAGNYGHLKLFNFAFMGFDPYPRDMIVSNQIWFYIKPYFRVIRPLLATQHAVIYFLIFFYLVVQKQYRSLSFDARTFAVVSSLYAIFFLMLFPNYEDRYFVLPVTLMFLPLLSLFREEKVGSQV